MKVKVANEFWNSLKRMSGPGHCYRVARGWVISHLFRKASWGILKQWFKGYAWDSYYLLELEQAKLREMIAYHERNRRFVGCEYIIRDMKICVSLLDIMMEKRKLFHFTGNLKFSKPDESGTCEILPGNLTYHPDVYVNKRNATRFLTEEQVKHWHDDDIYKQKATALYYKIRYEHTGEWWD